MTDNPTIKKGKGEVHLFTYEDDVLALDVYSDTLLLLNKDGLNLLNHIEEREKLSFSDLSELPESDKTSEIKETFLELYSLYKEEALYAPPFESDMEFSPGLKGMCLFIDGRCNLNCSYCFVKSKTPVDYLAPMSFKIAQKALELLLKNSTHDKVEVDFFGGEPLLNFETLKNTLIFGKSLAKNNGIKIDFTLTTNATLLTSEVQDFLIEHDIETVLSLDGPPETNDLFRLDNSGKGTHDKAIKRIKEYSSKNPPPYYIRGTYTHDTLNFSDATRYLFEEGFRVVSMEPVVGDPREPFTLKEEDLPRVFSEYKTLSLWFLDELNKGKDLIFFHFLIDPLRGPDINRRVGGCGAGREYISISPQGYIYPCHQFVREEKFIMGNLEEGFTNSPLREEFIALSFLKKDTCKKCWARFYCSGGCHANHYFTSGSLYTPHKIECAILQKRLEWSLWLKVRRLEEDRTTQRISTGE